MPPVKLTLALTGGIASGKSTALTCLRRIQPDLVSVDCDEEVGRLLDSDQEVSEALVDQFGPDAILSTGGANRAFLRRCTFGNPDKRRALEDILHPRIRQECLARHSRWARSEESSLFVADVPLLFENGFQFPYDHAVVVAVSRETQVSRIKQRNGFDDELISQILSAQLSMEEKLQKADFVLWNEGPESVLMAQIQSLVRFFEHMSEETAVPEAPETETVAAVSEAVPAPKPDYNIPELTQVNDLRALPLPELYSLLEALPIRIPANATKAQLVYELVAFYLKEGGQCQVSGILERSKEAFGMLRDPLRSFKTSADDIYIAGQTLSEHGIRVGQIVTVSLRPSRGRDKFLAADKVLSIDGIPAGDFEAPKDFDRLTAMFPDERFMLERGKEGPVSVRVVDLVAPLGKGQRGLIVAPPRGGKTILLKQIAKSIQDNHPESELVILLLDERPEEVTDFEETVDATVYSSTFDESHMRHAQVSDLALERAKRLVEQGKDVVLLLDSLTRLARGHNSAIRGGPVGSGGISSKALQQSRKFFNAARNCEEGGSLTILATALVETENRMDEVIFEEFKGTGNMEIKLDQELAERRVWPAIHIPQSGTRNDDRLYHQDEMARVLDIRRQLSQLPVGDAIMLLIKNLERTSTNAELLLSGIR